MHFLTIPCGVILAAAASAQSVLPPFDTTYQFANLGPLPFGYGGTAFLPANPNALLISPYGGTTIHQVPLTRSVQGQITGFGTATPFATVGGCDGGLAFGPNNVLFATWYGPNRLSQLKSSTVTRRDGERLEVAQSIEARVGPFRFSSSSVRAVELTPQREIRSTLVSGDFDTFVGTTRLVERGAVTAIVNHSEYAPKAWIPPLIGTGAIESETRKQYQQLLAEMVRRTAQRAAPAAR